MRKWTSKFFSSYSHNKKTLTIPYSTPLPYSFPSPRIVKKSHSFVATNANKKDYFVQPQTPTITHRSYSVMRSNTSSLILNSPKQQSPLITSTGAGATSTTGGSGLIKEPILQLPTAKRLFMSPGRTKSMTAITVTNNKNTNITNAATTNATTTTTTIAATTTTTTTNETTNVVNMKLPIQQHLQHQRPLTPLNKLRGLFSAYRECLDTSSGQLSTSPTSP